MGVFSRLSDIIQANLNALLDRAEDPEKMIRNIILEMEDTLVEVRTNAAKAIAEQKRLQRELGVLAEQQQQWQDKAALALSKQREDLAKAALLEKNKLASQAEQLQQQLSFYSDDLQKYDEDIAHLQEKIKDARSRQQKLMRRQQTAQTQLKVRQQSGERLTRAVSEMERFEQKIDDLDGQVEAYDLGNKTLANEFAELEAEDKITQELQALKQQIEQKKSQGGNH